jgi:hypothetical protein
MASVREVKVSIVGDSDSMVRAFRNADKAATGFGRGGSALMAAGMGAVAGGAAVAAQAIGTGLVTALKTGFDEMQQQQAVSAQTAAALKSTGNAAGVTKGHIENMASALQAQTGTQDDAIQSAQNLMLTFTSISNKGPDKMFDRSTKAALDLSVAFHKNLNASAVMVGKALNDPVKGVSALTRVGVQFTKGQKATIKALVDTGQSAKAQKLILHELEVQVGGSAKAFGETTPGQIQKAKRAFEDLSQGAVQAIAPIGAAILPALVTAMRGTVTWFQANWPKIKQIAMQVWQWFQTNLLPTFMEIGRGIASIVVSIVGIFRQYWPQIMAVVRPIIDNFKNTVVTAFGIIKGVINVVAALLRGDFSGAWSALKGLVATILKGVVTGLKNLASEFAAMVVLVGKAAFDLGVKIAGAIVRGIASAPANIVRIVAGWFGADSVGTGAQPFAVKNGKVVGIAIKDGIGQGVMTGTSKITDAVTKASGDGASAAKGPAGEKAKPVGQALSDGIAQGVRNGGPGVSGAIGDVIRQGIQDAKSANGIKSPSTKTANELGKPLGQGVASGIKSQKQVVVAAMSSIIKGAIASAKTNALSLASSFGALLGQSRTAGDSSRLSGLQSGLSGRQTARQKQALDDAKTAADADVLIKQSAIATAEDKVQAQRDYTDALKVQADAAVAIQDFADQQEIDNLSASIDTRKTKYQEDTDNLAASFAAGTISAEQFQTDLTALIGGETGASLGAAFVLSFGLALSGLVAQIGKIGSGVGGVAPEGPNVVDPADAAAAEQARQSGLWPARAKAATVRINKLPQNQRRAAWLKWVAEHGENSDVAHGFATGGIVTAPMQGLVGEAGPEAIIPLSSPKAKEMLSGAGAGGGNVINLTFNGILDAKDAARALRPELDRLVRLAV